MTDEVGRSAYDIDPELAEFAELMSSMPLLTDVREARALILDFVGPLNAGIDVSGLDIDDRTIPGPPDAPDVTVRVYRPQAVPAPVPAVLKIHGGGFVTGSIDTEHGMDVELSRRPARDCEHARVHRHSGVEPTQRRTELGVVPRQHASGSGVALRLLQAGVSVELHSSPGTFHGSQVIGDAEVTQRENTEMMVVLRRALDLG